MVTDWSTMQTGVVDMCETICLKKRLIHPPFHSLHLNPSTEHAEVSKKSNFKVLVPLPPQGVLFLCRGYKLKIVPFLFKTKSSTSLNWAWNSQKRYLMTSLCIQVFRRILDCKDCPSVMSLTLWSTKGVTSFPRTPWSLRTTNRNKRTSQPLAPVVERVNSTLHWINPYSLGNSILRELIHRISVGQGLVPRKPRELLEHKKPVVNWNCNPIVLKSWSFNIF